ncbi:MAG: hypothetical protein GF346_04915 [Candidatus Eisenbacteria bacterium]|nr:hypothetical protein [Candidatus Latescibacterota bacterium]MBD3301767.1 hypothetical protein [Candidatus Eisenbacteria bacterium]
MKRLLMIVCALALATAANADVPDPSQCLSSLDDTGRLYMCPDDNTGDCAAADFTVTVKNANNDVIPNATVEILVGGQVDGYTVICAGEVLVQNANANGVAMFNIAGGGCYKAADACVIRANGVEIRTYDTVVSADYSFSDNGNTVGGGDYDVDPVDLGAFVAAYQGGVGPTSCHDYNNDGGTEPVDLGTFVAAYQGGINFCDAP